MQAAEIIRAFRTPEQAAEHLELKRWADEPECPYCKSKEVGVHASPDRNVRRWQCRACGRPFSALVGTIFQGTHVPLRSWFLLLALVLPNPGKVSAAGLARELNMRRPTISRMLKLIRSALANDAQQTALFARLIGSKESGDPLGGKTCGE